ncbi:Lysine-specific demethylase REF6, partial [Mucuna pruriens]
MGGSSEGNGDVLPWLKSLPVAPEYRPSAAEFQDPIGYIFKIEKEASKYGICKIIPPFPPSPKKTAIANLNRSLADTGSTFTTRQQQIGFCPRRPRPVKRPVWQSGDHYTFQEFESKAKSFEKTYLKRHAKKGSGTGLGPLETETLFWKATLDKPFSVEYANDMPGSAFSPKCRHAGDPSSLADTPWNMRAVSRANGSLLRFMKEEIPGVTSPMVYVAMLFSWFAWHVEDHDLHSLNYLHMGAGKTWYGVPRDAAVAFEEVVRVHGYGGEINPLVTFAILGEKTTVMSPEVFVSAGVPCCRLVQNAGEFVVTFPRAYHTGFSHGFNCGEAANIATPEWLRVAKDAAIRRASLNYPPMVSHFQLLYDLALALCSRIPVGISAEPRSSRLKDKKKGEGETVIKELFVQDVLQNNDLLHILGKGSAVVLLPRSSVDISVCSKLRVGSQQSINVSNSEGLHSSKGFVSDDLVFNRSHGIKLEQSFYSVKDKFTTMCERNRISSFDVNSNTSTSSSKPLQRDTERETSQGDGLSDQRFFSCVTCGILSFSCVAIVQPREPAARYLMSADCSFFNDWVVGSGVSSNKFTIAHEDATIPEPNTYTGSLVG